MTLPRTPSFSLKGKRAIVTGATSGIGEGCAVALAEAGAHVTLVARTAIASGGWMTTLKTTPPAELKELLMRAKRGQR